MAPSDDTASIRRDIRRLSLRTWLLSLRLSARRVCDLPGLGTGPLERLAAALVIGAVFFLVYLLAATLIGFGRNEGLLVGISAFVVVMMTTGLLILWDSDEGVKRDRDTASARLAELKLLAADREEVEGGQKYEAQIPTVQTIGRSRGGRSAPSTSMNAGRLSS